MRAPLKKFLLVFTLVSSLCRPSVNAQDWHPRDSLLTLLSKSGQDTVRISLLLKLAQFEIFKTGEYKIDLDSAGVYIEAAKTINTRAQSPQAAGWIVLTESYLLKEHEEQRPQGKALAEKAVAMLQQANDPFHLAEAYRAVSEYYNKDNTEELPKKIALLEKSVAQFKAAGAITDEAAGYQLLGELYDGDSLILSSLQKALELFQSVHYTLLQGVYGNLTGYYYWKSDFKEAIHYAILALSTADAQHDTSAQLCELANQIGILFDRMEQYNEAIPYFIRGLERAEALHDNKAIYITAMNVAANYVNLKQPLKAKLFLDHIAQQYALPKDNALLLSQVAVSFLRVYMALGEFGNARPYADRLKLFLKDNPYMEIMGQNSMHFTLVKYYLDSRQYAEAKVQLKSIDSLKARVGDPRGEETNEFLWFRLDTAQGQYADAIHRLLKSKDLHDSLFNETKSQQIHQLEVAFDTKKKEDQIRLLNQQAQLEKANLYEANLVKNFSFGSVVLAMVIAGLLFRQNRIKQKNNRLTLHKNEQLEHLVKEKEWLLREVHHRVKNNLHTVICLLESQASYLENDALLAIQNSGNRIYAMSLIHQKLYQTEDVRMIDMENYITEFIRYLQDGFGVPSNIRIELNIETLTLAVALAIPLGLIINEAVTNSFKYAFPGGETGLISVRLYRAGKRVLLTIADDGKGFEYDPEGPGSSSFGLELINGLAREIRGIICFDGCKGTTITISFEQDLLETASHMNAG
jgi:two-component system, sensor histidine kinase PdtaS